MTLIEDISQTNKKSLSGVIKNLKEQKYGGDYSYDKRTPIEHSPNFINL